VCCLHLFEIPWGIFLPRIGKIGCRRRRCPCCRRRRPLVLLFLLVVVVVVVVHVVLVIVTRKLNADLTTMNAICGDLLQLLTHFVTNSYTVICTQLNVYLPC